jgi:hypothetical protein
MLTGGLKMEELEDCNDNLIQRLSFEGGPLDGCVLVVPGDRFICDIFIGVPAKMQGDNDESMTGEAVHQYTVCNTTQMEGSNDVDHYMGHVAVRKVSLSVLNKVFQASQKITPENQEWIDGVNAAVQRLEQKDEIGFDVNNDDETDEEREQDGEGWKNA